MEVTVLLFIVWDCLYRLYKEYKQYPVIVIVEIIGVTVGNNAVSIMVVIAEINAENIFIKC